MTFFSSPTLQTINRPFQNIDGKKSVFIIYFSLSLIRTFVIININVFTIQNRSIRVFLRS